jgi:NADH-quinone oxidoreductase subunit C
MEQSSIIDALASAVPAATPQVVPAVDMETILVARESIVDVCRVLRDDPAFQFGFLSDVIGVDLLPEEPRYEIVYLLASLGAAFTTAGNTTPAPARRLRLKVALPAADPKVDTVSSLWPSAAWPEREIFDLFGVRFHNHPDLRRILMTDDWEGHPLRKDYAIETRCAPWR